MSHERMLKTEAQLEEEIAALLRKAELIDAQEDACYGKSKRGDELPKELQRRQDRLDALREAKRGLAGLQEHDFQLPSLSPSLLRYASGCMNPSLKRPTNLEI